MLLTILRANVSVSFHWRYMSILHKLENWPLKLQDYRGFFFFFSSILTTGISYLLSCAGLKCRSFYLITSDYLLTYKGDDKCLRRCRYQLIEGKICQFSTFGGKLLLTSNDRVQDSIADSYNPPKHVFDIVWSFEELFNKRQRLYKFKNK